MTRTRLPLWWFIMIAIGLAPSCRSEPGFQAPPGSFTESNARVGADAAELTVASVDSTFFGAAAPLLGRAFAREDYGGQTRVAIVSHGFWSERLGARPDVIGTDIQVDGEPRTIVGVMPAGVDEPTGVALWLPRP